jgi:hypothetical protein
VDEGEVAKVAMVAMVAIVAIVAIVARAIVVVVTRDVTWTLVFPLAYLSTS